MVAGLLGSWLGRAVVSGLELQRRLPLQVLQLLGDLLAPRPKGGPGRSSPVLHENAISSRGIPVPIMLNSNLKQKIYLSGLRLH